MNELIEVLTNNIWLILLLIIMFNRKPYKIQAMILLTSKVIFNSIPSWLIIIMVTIGILIDINTYQGDVK
jgi:hypothetical protein